MVDVPDLGSGFCRFESGPGHRSLGEMVDTAALKAAPLRGTGSSPVASSKLAAIVYR